MMQNDEKLFKKIFSCLKKDDFDVSDDLNFRSQYIVLIRP